MAYAPLARLSLPRIVRWRVVPVCQSSPVTSHPVASFHPLTNTISDDVLTAGIILGELTSARVHLASHLFSFVFQLTHSTPLGVSTVGPMASTPIILSFIFSVVWLMLFTTKASYPAVTTDCSDCTHSVEVGNPHVMSNVPAKRLLLESEAWHRQVWRHARKLRVSFSLLRLLSLRVCPRRCQIPLV